MDYEFQKIAKEVGLVPWVNSQNHFIVHLLALVGNVIISTNTF